MLTCSDFDGVWFSLQAIRLYHPEVLDEIEFLIINNGPENAHSEAVNKLKNWIKEPIRTFGLMEMGTAQRSRLFDLAETPYVLCLDSHVLLVPGSLRKLIDFFDSQLDEGNLLQGPMLYDDLSNVATHMEPVWRDQMWGIWATDERGKDPNAQSFEIPAQGLGLFACRKDAWLGFNPCFSGFGGEECYLHEKYRQAGKKTLCLPFLRWLHRFGRPSGATYSLRTEDRVRNYLIGHAELGLDPAPVIAHFTPILGEKKMQELVEEIQRQPSTSAICQSAAVCS